MIKEKCVWWQRTSEQLGQRMLRFPLSANAYTWIFQNANTGYLVTLTDWDYNKYECYV